MTVPDQDCRGCALSRRAFVERSALAALSTVLLSSCGDGQIGGVFAPDGGGTVRLVVNLADFPELATIGGTARVDNGSSVPIGVSRTGPSTFVAVSMICTHAAFRPIDVRPVGYRCPNHGALFADDGTWAGGQPTSDLPRYVATLDAGTNTLTIT
jgi:Rieske Fe-S protein